MTPMEICEAADGHHSTPTDRESHPKKMRCHLLRRNRNKLLMLVVVLCVLNFITLPYLAVFGDFRRYSPSPEVGDTSPLLSSSSGDIAAEPSESTGAGSQSIAETLAGQEGNKVFHIGLRQDPSIQDCLTGGMKQTFPDIDYSFYGYNVLKGYPLADGRDPGFTRPLFAFNFSSGGHTADCRYALPKGLTAAPDVSCRTSFTSNTVSNSNELKESLNVNAKVSGSGLGVSFSGSSDYKEASSIVSKGESKVIQSTASCKYYFSKLNRLDMPAFSSEMKVWLKRMEASLDKTNTIDDNLIYEFIDYFGTHMPISMVYGARFTYQSRVSSADYERLSESDISVEAQASYSGAFNLGGGFGMSDTKKSAAANFSEKTETSTLSVGAPPPYNGDAMTWASTVKDTPVPVQYELVPIYELFNKEYNMHPYFEELITRQIRAKIMNYMTSYCGKASDHGLDVQCKDDSLIKFTNVALAENINEILRIELTPCIEECERRSYCVIFSWFNNGTCALGHNTGTFSHQWLGACKGCVTFFNPKGLSSPIEFNKYRYDSSVTRRNKLSVPWRSNLGDLWEDGYRELLAFCALHCSKDDNCIGYEVCKSTAYTYNCATYRHHSEHLVPTDDYYVFETNVIGDLAKRKIKEQNSYLTDRFTLSRNYFDKPPSGIEKIEECDALCCIRRCKDNMNCNSAMHILKDKEVCHHVLDEFQAPLTLINTNESSVLTLTVFHERASSGWFNVSGVAWESPISVPVNNADACADQCASNINCVCASWKRPKQLCFNIMHWENASTYESDAGSMLMYPNHIERIKRFKLT